MRVGAFAAARHVPETPSYKPIVAALMPHTFAEVRVGCRQTVVRGRVDPSTARYLCACSTLGWAGAHVSLDTRACWMLHRLCCGRLGLPLRSSRAWSRLDRSRPSLAPVEIVIAVELVVVAVPVEPVASPPSRVSSPAPPLTTSLPSPPKASSAPAVPMRMSSPAVPRVTLSQPAPKWRSGVSSRTDQRLRIRQNTNPCEVSFRARPTDGTRELRLV